MHLHINLPKEVLTTFLKLVHLYNNLLMEMHRQFSISHNKLICNSHNKMVQNSQDQLLLLQMPLDKQSLEDQCQHRLGNQLSKDKITHLEKEEDWDTLAIMMIKRKSLKRKREMKITIELSLQIKRLMRKAKLCFINYLLVTIA